MTTKPEPLRPDGAARAVARPEKWSAAELAEVVNTWCRLRGVEPVSGQAAPELTERIVRFYRTQGIIDPPQGAGGSGSARSSFGRKHRLQLNLLRLLQAEGMPLRRIQELLFGRSEDELAELEQHAVRPGTSLLPRTAADAMRAEQAAAEAITEHQPVTTSDEASRAGDGDFGTASQPWPSWRIGKDFAIVTISGRRLTEAEFAAIHAILNPPEEAPVSPSS